MDWNEVYSVESRSEGLARFPQPEDQLPLLKSGPLMRRPFQNLLGGFPLCLLPSPSPYLEDAWGFYLSPHTKTSQIDPNFIPQPSKLIKEEEEYEMDTIHAY